MPARRRTGDLLSRVWLRRCSPEGPADPSSGDGAASCFPSSFPRIGLDLADLAPGTPPPGGSPRAAQPPLERATSAPALDRLGSGGGIDGGGGSPVPHGGAAWAAGGRFADSLVAEAADTEGQRRSRHGTGELGGGGVLGGSLDGDSTGGGGVAGSRRRGRCHSNAPSFDPAAYGGFASEDEFLSEDEVFEQDFGEEFDDGFGEFASPRSHFSGSSPQGPSPHRGFTDLASPPGPMHMGYHSDSASSSEVWNIALL